MDNSQIFFSILVLMSHVVLQEHVEGYHELSAKTKIFSSTAVAKWDADFYVKVDNDVHVNLGIHCLFSFSFLVIFFLHFFPQFWVAFVNFEFAE